MASEDFSFEYITEVYDALVDLDPARINFQGQEIVSVLPSDLLRVGAPGVVTQDSEGNVLAVNGSLIQAYLLPILRRYRDRITVLENRLSVAMALVDDAHAKLAKLTGDAPWS